MFTVSLVSKVSQLGSSLLSIILEKEEYNKYNLFSLDQKLFIFEVSLNLIDFVCLFVEALTNKVVG